MDPVKTLNRLVDLLYRRQSEADELSGAYEGKHKLTYASANFEEFFSGRYDKFSDNWCGIVADAPHERLEPKGLQIPGDEDDNRGAQLLWEVWKSSDGESLGDMALLEALIAKRSYALVWGDDDAGTTISFEHPNQCYVEYDPATRERRYGIKWWTDDDREMATLYTPEWLFKYSRKRTTETGLILSPRARAELMHQGDWVARDAEGEPWPLPNPMGMVPLVELPNRPRLGGEPMSDISGTLAMQHAINLFWAELFAVSDEATIGQRLIIGAERPEVPVLNADGQVVGSRKLDLKELRKASRNPVLWLEDPAAKADQWDAAKFDVFTNVIEIMVGHIAAQTRTPAHYLLIGGTIANVSGDAMKALETGLVKRTEEKTLHFGRALRDVFELVALAEDNPFLAMMVGRGAKVLWKDVENRSDAQLADSLSKKRQIGYPLQYILQQDPRVDPEDIPGIMDMVREEASDPVMQRIMGKLPSPTPEQEPAVADEDAALGG